VSTVRRKREGERKRTFEAQVADRRSGVGNGCDAIGRMKTEWVGEEQGAEKIKVSLERTGEEKGNAPFQLWTVPLFCTTPLYLPYLPRSTTGAEEDEEEDDDEEEEEVGTARAEEARARRARRGVPMSILKRESVVEGRKRTRRFFCFSSIPSFAPTSLRQHQGKAFTALPHDSVAKRAPVASKTRLRCSLTPGKVESEKPVEVAGESKGTKGVRDEGERFTVERFSQEHGKTIGSDSRGVGRRAEREEDEEGGVRGKGSGKGRTWTGDWRGQHWRC
jgi:hypothetical protein